ncbi:MAG: hypothetical protein RL154_1067 [Pseudomonadota bacterium]|jgi:hypothetical protein
MKSLIFIAVILTQVFAFEAIISYPESFEQDAFGLQQKCIKDIYLGMIKSDEAFLNKNGLIALKLEKIDLLYIKKSVLESLELKPQQFANYNLKILVETKEYYLVSRLSWFDGLSDSTKKPLIQNYIER